MPQSHSAEVRLTNDVSGAQCHGVPSSFYEVNCTFCLSWLLRPYQERKRKQKSAVEYLWYFSALSRGDPLPVKDRIEMPVATQKTDTGLTQGMLKVLHKQCSHKQYVELVDLEQKWRSLCLPMEKFRALLQLDPCEYRIEWIKFLALGCSMLGGSLNTAMKNLCEILTQDPEGGPARIPFKTFSYVYRYLSSLDSDIATSETEAYLASLKDSIDNRKNGMIGLMDFFVITRKM
ncbi:PREDICTED: ropporin-1-like protein isoform X3 [Myotis brandtii]|uniref:ropporin-1-like protein isoform X3 n=1 Tax=Myotis brandtii TaxID=109478 RepID=UPI000704140D|nr:PREDICTED: ropporin-1-like protein isoform X3 [Myotis brandtii]